MSPSSATQSSRTETDLERRANRLLQVGIVAAFLAGVRRRDVSVVVNGVLSLAFAAGPRYVERRYGVSVRPWQRLWVSAAALVHAVGMLGPYDRIWWWDHVAHALSGAIVGATADVVFRATGGATRSRPTFVVGVTLAFGVVWEVLEFAAHRLGNRIGVEPLLVHYGRFDTVGDLVFDVVGAALVVAFGRGPLANVVDSIASE